MSKHTIFLSLVLLLSVGLLALTGCAPPETAAVEAVAAFDYEAAAEVSAYRWLAMAKAYERMGLLNDEMDPGEVSAFRWEAMARAYERMGLLNDAMDPGDVAAVRWEATAKAYERMGLLNEQH